MTRDETTRGGAPMCKCFTLRIELSDRAMNGPDGVACELRRLADLIEEGFTSGPIVDEDGNAVGRWEYGAR